MLMMSESGRKADIILGPIINCERLQDLLKNAICASLSAASSTNTYRSISRFPVGLWVIREARLTHVYGSATSMYGARAAIRKARCSSTLRANSSSRVRASLILRSNSFFCSRRA